ncbi:MAG: hypothetical protein H0X33_11180 [Taibaiella sp.]|nr:hypothetical protein [Taibaiella sp.]
MKTSRLLGYAVAGIIAGLLIENKALTVRKDISDTAGKLKKKAGKAVDEAKEKLSGLAG